jgi:hypothetical protein
MELGAAIAAQASESVAREAGRMDAQKEAFSVADFPLQYDHMVLAVPVVDEADDGEMAVFRGEIGDRGHHHADFLGAVRAC